MESVSLKIFKNKKIYICLISISLLIALTVGGSVLYVSDYYRADVSAIESFAVGEPVTKTMMDDGVIAYGASDAEYGFIFYPGGKVEYTAYEPLMRCLASEGVLCVLLEMPCNLAVLDMNAADGICEQYPEIDHWYIGGHSLGGTMAAYYAEASGGQLEGLVLLGSYSSKDLSDTSLRVLSVFGSEDDIMNDEKYEECKVNLPFLFTEIEMEGGCHAYFGMYGAQDGDGTPTLTAEEQIRKTAEYIIEFIMKGELDAKDH